MRTFHVNVPIVTLICCQLDARRPVLWTVGSVDLFDDGLVFIVFLRRLTRTQDRDGEGMRF